MPKVCRKDCGEHLVYRHPVGFIKTVSVGQRAFCRPVNQRCDITRQISVEALNNIPLVCPFHTGHKDRCKRECTGAWISPSIRRQCVWVVSTVAGLEGGVRPLLPVRSMVSRQIGLMRVPGLRPLLAAGPAHSQIALTPELPAIASLPSADIRDPSRCEHGPVGHPAVRCPFFPGTHARQLLD